MGAEELKFGKDVVNLDKDNFDTFINQETVLVAFTAPWCGHCKRLKEPMSEAATLLKAHGIQAGNVDATVHGDLAKRFGVRGYPTLKIFKSGKAQDYAGTRTKEGLYKTVKSKAGAAFEKKASAADVESFVKAQPEGYGFAVLGYFPTEGSKVAATFAAAAENFREIKNFAVVEGSEAATASGLTGEGIYVVRAFADDKTPEKFSGDVASVNDLTAWIYGRVRPLVGWYDDAYAPVYRAARIAKAKVFAPLAAIDATQFRYLANRVKAAAEKHASVIATSIAGTGDGIARQEVSQFGFSKNPIVVIQDKNDASVVYKMADAFSPEAVEKFFDAYVAGTLERHIKSEPVPASNDGPVAVVVGKTFDELVANNTEQDVLIEFYAPWCGHCKTLEPKYKALGEKIKKEVSDRQIVIAKLDATANDWTKGKYPVTGYPTLFFKPAGGVPKTYSGARETEALFKFVTENAKSKAKVTDGKDEL